MPTSQTDLDRIREALAKRATITVECQPEDVPFVGNCSAIDDETDAATELWIAHQLHAGNQWAWCCVKVTATWECFTDHTGLGCCSYESEESFRECQYDTLSSEALDALAARVYESKRAITALLGDAS